MIDSQQLSVVLGQVLNFNGKRVLYGRISVVSLIINASQSASNLLILNIIPPRPPTLWLSKLWSRL